MAMTGTPKDNNKNPDELPTRDGQPFGDPIPPGTEPTDDAVADATPHVENEKKALKPGGVKNKSVDQIEAEEGKFHPQTNDQRSDVSAKDPNHPAREGQK